MMPKQRPSFEDALGDLLAEYHDAGNDALISAMELQIMALKEAEEHESE